MTPIIEPRRFRDVYRDSVEDVMRFVTRERQEVIARHDLSLHPDQQDLGAYLRASERRYLELVRLYNEYASTTDLELSALEVGGFLCAYPLTLVRLGIPVTAVEQFNYYGGALDELAAFVQAEGVRIWDADFTRPISDPPERFTLVTNMAMLEHLADSPKILMNNLRACADDHGLLVVDVPNVAYWPNRLEALRGQSIHQPLDLVYGSAVPYLGHHREYTVSELRELLAWSGFDVREVQLFNYSLSLQNGAWSSRIYALLLYWPAFTFSRCREVIIASAVPHQEQMRGPLPGARNGDRVG